MSIGGGDEYGARDRRGEEGPAYDGGTSRFTRTRLPEGETASRPAAESRGPGRSVVTVVGVVVLLIAAIAFANRGGGDDRDSGDKGGAQAAPTAPSGDTPVKTADGDVPSGFPHSEEGAQSAAANYAVALGGDGMFNRDDRHSIVSSVAAPSSAKSLQSGLDADYSESLNEKIGLDAEGKAPEGSTFVNRTQPAGTKATSYSSSKATVEVWCSGLFGIAGTGSKTPVTNSWFTMTLQLSWTGGDWKVTGSQQKDGPTPLNGDNPASGAKEIGKAVEEYGGFTYAR